MLSEDPSLINQKNASGQSAVLLAKYYRQFPIADYLLSLNPELDVFSAAAVGRADLVLADIERDAALIGAHSSDGWTVLHLAAFFGHCDLAQELIAHGADVDARA